MCQCVEHPARRDLRRVDLRDDRLSSRLVHPIRHGFRCARWVRGVTVGTTERQASGKHVHNRLGRARLRTVASVVTPDTLASPVGGSKVDVSAAHAGAGTRVAGDSGARRADGD